MRLIDADVLRNALRITGTNESCKGCKHESHNWACCKDDLQLNYICEILDKQPTVKTAPFIKCKDCVFWGTRIDTLKRGYCRKYDHTARGKDYCAWGERKEE